MEDVTTLPKPISIGGVGSSIEATAYGYLPWFPDGFNGCYYAPACAYTLISTGYICRAGGRVGQERTSFELTDLRPKVPQLLYKGPLHEDNLVHIHRDFRRKRRSSLRNPPAFVAAGLTSPFSDGRPHYTPEQLTRANVAELAHQAFCPP